MGAHYAPMTGVNPRHFSPNSINCEHWNPHANRWSTTNPMNTRSGRLETKCIFILEKFRLISTPSLTGRPSMSEKTCVVSFRFTDVFVIHHRRNACRFRYRFSCAPAKPNRASTSESRGFMPPSVSPNDFILICYKQIS